MIRVSGTVPDFELIVQANTQFRVLLLFTMIKTYSVKLYIIVGILRQF